MALLPALLALQAAMAPRLVATRTDKPPTIDGRLDEAAWRRAAPTDAFTQRAPDEGKPAVERTVVRVLYDDAAIYVGFACEQTLAPVVARLTRRDRQVEADSVSIALDTRGDGKSAFELTVNAAGVLSDGEYTNDSDFSRDWDAIWEARAAITATGWSAELRIPLRALRYEPKDAHSFGLQLSRYVSARQEIDHWSFAPRSSAGHVSHFGRLDGITGLRARHDVEIVPFVTGRLERRDVAPGDPDPGLEPGASAGLDLRWHVTPQLTLNATANPDFGQVEADPAVLNLGTFETFYPEKRQFFLEGADLFQTPLTLVYTRRVGRAPRAPEVLDAPPFGEALTEDPTPSPIYGAAKLVGKLGQGVSIGELVAVTGRQRLAARREDGTTALRVADPLTTYKVLRLRRDVGDGGQVGAIVMATNRHEPAGEYPILPSRPGAGPTQLCPGGEEVRPGARCFHDAYVGGVDGRWRSPSGDYVVSGQVAGSFIQEGPPRAMRDGTVIASGDASPTGQLRVAKEGGRWLWEARYEGQGRHVDYNDLGYMRRQNRHGGFASVRYRTLEPWWETLETKTTLGVFDQETLNFLNLERGAFFESAWKLKNFWEVFASVSFAGDHFDDREVGDGTALERTGYAGVAAYVGTDPRARVRGDLFSYVDLFEGGAEWLIEAGVTLKALPQLEITLSPTAFSTAGQRRYFGSERGMYLFGTQRAGSLGLTLRATYTFTPQLTLEAYAQAFLSSEAYADHAAFPVADAGPGERILLRELGPAFSPVESDPDHESANLNANLVLRWEYRLGSTLYVVYTHGQGDTAYPGRSGVAGLNFSLLAPRLASDVLLAKLSYWWG